MSPQIMRDATSVSSDMAMLRLPQNWMRKNGLWWNHSCARKAMNSAPPQNVRCVMTGSGTSPVGPLIQHGHHAHDGRNPSMKPRQLKLRNRSQCDGSRGSPHPIMRTATAHSGSVSQHSHRQPTCSNHIASSGPPRLGPKVALMAHCQCRIPQRRRQVFEHDGHEDGRQAPADSPCTARRMHSVVMSGM